MQNICQGGFKSPLEGLVGKLRSWLEIFDLCLENVNRTKNRWINLHPSLFHLKSSLQ